MVMAFTTVTITGTFTNADGSNATGSVTAELSQAISNSDVTIEPTPITGAIVAGALKDITGNGNFTLLANDDSTTTPAGTFYVFTINVSGAAPQTIIASVPHSPTTVDISQLIPVNPGQQIALVNTLPVPSAAVRGQIQLKYGDGKTLSDVLYVCVLTTVGYQWVPLTQQNWPVGYFQ